jgi:hypothetical protein
VVLVAFGSALVMTELPSAEQPNEQDLAYYFVGCRALSGSPESTTVRPPPDGRGTLRRREITTWLGREGAMKRHRTVLGVILVALTALGVLDVSRHESAGAAATRLSPHMTIEPFGDDLIVHLDDPPTGQHYDGAYAMVVPPGVMWCLKAVTFHMSTGGVAKRRVSKFVLRDLNDTVGNVGRAYVVLGENVRQWVYVDFSLAQGLTFSPPTPGAGTSEGSRWITNMNGPLPQNLCAPHGYAWDTWFSGFQLSDSVSEWFAIVHEVAA